MRRPGVEPGTSAWKAPMLTVTPSTLAEKSTTSVYKPISKNKPCLKQQTHQTIKLGNKQ